MDKEEEIFLNLFCGCKGGGMPFSPISSWKVRDFKKKVRQALGKF